MSHLIRLDGETAPLLVVAERITYLEAILESRGGHVVVRDGVAVSTGTRIALDTGGELTVTDTLDIVEAKLAAAFLPGAPTIEGI